MTEPILSVDNLQTHFESQAGTVHAVDGVSFDIHPGEIVGVVGESGSGKSVTALSCMRLEDPGKIVGGSIQFKGEELTDATEHEIRRIRGRGMSMVFQDPMTTLNPVFKVSEQIVESLKVHDNPEAQSLFDFMKVPLLHNRSDWAAKQERVVELMEEVGIPKAQERLDAYPHEFSGGMRQRAMLAIALASKPDLLIADEPTTALDVTIQAQVLRNISDLRDNRDMSVLLITHDMGVVADICDRVVVMYGGEIMETGTTEQVLTDPKHPYTKALLECLPQRTSRKDELETIEGQVPDAVGGIDGCPFANRCEYRHDRCLTGEMPTIDCGDGQQAKCCRVEEINDGFPSNSYAEEQTATEESAE